MSVVSDLAAVVELACCIEAREDNEQRALLRTAMRIDNERNRLTVTNHRDRSEPASVLLALVCQTRILVDNHRPVFVTPPEHDRWQRHVDNWEAQRKATRA